MWGRKTAVRLNGFGGEFHSLSAASNDSFTQILQKEA